MKKILGFEQLKYKGSYIPLLFLTMLFLVAMYVRYRLVPIVTSDFTDFLHPWITHMREHGLAGLADIQSNYNAPYLILLWLASFLPFSDLMNVKLISIGFDVLMAIGVSLIVSHFYPRRIRAVGAGFATLMAPVVLQNGAAWGQCDAIYTTFIVFSLLMALRNKQFAAWILWGVALAFKLQALFFVIPLAAIWIHNKERIYAKDFLAPLGSIVTFVVLSAIPALFGKRLADIFSIYVNQASPIRTDWGLAWFSPTAYNWVSNTNFNEIRNAGIAMAAFLACAGVALVWMYRFKNKKDLLVFATALLLGVLFMVPQLHERYLFSAEAMLVIVAFVVPRFAWAAILMQVISTITYSSYFSQANMPAPIPYPWLALGVLAIVYTMASTAVKNLSLRKKLITIQLLTDRKA